MKNLRYIIIITMGVYYGDEFAGVLLRCEDDTNLIETKIMYEIKFDVITDKIKNEIHTILEDVANKEFSIFVWTSCSSTFDDCEYMTWQRVTKEQLLSEMAKPILSIEKNTQDICYIPCGWPSI